MVLRSPRRAGADCLGAPETKRICHGSAVPTGVFGTKEGTVAFVVEFPPSVGKTVADPLPAAVVGSGMFMLVVVKGTALVKLVVIIENGLTCMPDVVVLLPVDRPDDVVEVGLRRLENPVPLD